MTTFRNIHTDEVRKTPDADRFTDNRCPFDWKAVSAGGQPPCPSAHGIATGHHFGPVSPTGAAGVANRLNQSLPDGVMPGLPVNSPGVKARRGFFGTLGAQWIDEQIERAT